LDFKLHLQQENAQHSDETQEQVIDAEHSDDSFGKTDVCQVFDDETLEIEGIEKPELQQVSCSLHLFVGFISHLRAFVRDVH